MDSTHQNTKSCCPKCADVEDMSGDGIGGARHYCNNPNCECHFPNPLADWKVEFDAKFPTIENITSVPITLAKNGAEEIKSFIENLLLQARAEERAKVLSEIVSKVLEIKQNVREEEGSFKYDSCYDDILIALSPLKDNK